PTPLCMTFGWVADVLLMITIPESRTIAEGEDLSIEAGSA
ncbi:MAG: hypothetical protein K0Q71_5774, partial [Thermomicrobiales bacterium]|nr:hypothetical protein [Thermomicrobiales bacterium]